MASNLNVSVVDLSPLGKPVQFGPIASIYHSQGFHMTEETQDQNSLIKQQYLQTFFAKYTDLVNYVNTLPIHVQLKQNSITRLDEGMFWVREGIAHIQTVIPEAPVDEIPPDTL